MSEEKMYVVKNDEGKYWDFIDPGEFQELSIVYSSTTNSKEQAELVADERGGHVVTFIEEPEKVVLTKEQAEIVDDAHASGLPATYISINAEDGEELLMDAYVNGYTLAKDNKRYLVELDGLVTTDGAEQYLTKEDGKWFACQRMPGLHQDLLTKSLKMLLNGLNN